VLQPRVVSSTDRESTLANIQGLSTQHEELVRRHSEEVRRNSKRAELSRELAALEKQQSELATRICAIRNKLLELESHGSNNVPRISQTKPSGSSGSNDQEHNSTGSSGGAQSSSDDTKLNQGIGGDITDRSNLLLDVPHTPPTSHTKGSALARQSQTSTTPKTELPASPRTDGMLRSSSEPLSPRSPKPAAESTSTSTSPSTATSGVCSADPTPASESSGDETIEAMAEKVLRRVTSPRRKILRHSATSSMTFSPVGVSSGIGRSGSTPEPTMFGVEPRTRAASVAPLDVVCFVASTNSFVYHRWTTHFD
jgi:hypothetical protein